MRVMEHEQKVQSMTRGFPAPGQKAYTTPIFIVKLLGVVLFSVLDTAWTFIRHQLVIIAGSLRGRDLLNVLARYREYTHRLAVYAEKKGSRILGTLSLRSAYKLINEYRKRHFRDEEAHLIFGSEGSVYNFRDFQRLYETVMKEKGLVGKLTGEETPDNRPFAVHVKTGRR